ncbi:MAG TPA: antibiotic biosynthesis monooxygenase [Ktedonobacteraceae bacterium]
MSYARIVIVSAQAGKIDEILEIYRNSVIPAARQQKGFLGSRMFVDRANNKGISVTRWASKADLEAGEANGYFQEQIAKFGPLFASAPVREVYEIAAEEN